MTILPDGTIARTGQEWAQSWHGDRTGPALQQVQMQPVDTAMLPSGHRNGRSAGEQPEGENCHLQTGTPFPHEAGRDGGLERLISCRGRPGQQETGVE
jgi:hypothetical protein